MSKEICIRFCVLSLLLFTGGVVRLYAQLSGYPYIRNYTPREYKASSANYSTVQDARGIMYFGNYRGILEYDGANWKLMPLNNRGVVFSLAVDSSGKVYVGGSGEFGYLRPDEKGAQTYQSLVQFLPESERAFSGVVRVIGARSGAFFHVFDSRRLYYWDGINLHTVYASEPAETASQFFYRFDRLWQVAGDKGLRVYDGEGFKDFPGGEQLAGNLLFSLTVTGKKQLLTWEYSRGFLKLDFTDDKLKIQPFRTEIEDLLAESNFSSVLALSEDRILVTTARAGAFVLDAQGRLLQKINQRSGLQDNLITSAYMDQNHSLWLTLSKGISRVEVNSPLTQWKESSGLRGIVFSSIRHNDIFYASTTQGVFRLEEDYFKPIPEIDAESWRLVSFKMPGQPSRLLVTTVQGIYEIRGSTATLVSQDLICFEAYPSRKYPGRIYCLSGRSTVEIITYANGKWSKPQSIAGLSGRFKSIEEDDEGNIWLVELLGEGSVIRAKVDAAGNAELQRYDSRQGLPPVNGVHIVKSKPVFSTDRGVYRLDEEKGNFVPDEQITRFGSMGVSSLSEDNQGKVWLERYSEERRWVEVAQEGSNGWVRDSVMLSGLADTEIWGNLYPENNGMTWIGTPEGLFCYNSNMKLPPRIAMVPLIRKVSIGPDSVIFAGTCAGGDCNNTPVIQYANNSLTFQYVAPNYDQEYGTRYSYYLSGRDEEWSPWTDQLKKDYTLLPPGRYEFMVKARNAYNEESPVVSYSFIIAPPWYRKPWAFVSYGVLLIGLVYGTVKLNTRRLFLHNEHLERLVYERTTEIWEQHKEIVKKTVALKRQKEEIATQHDLLETKNKELEDAVNQLKTAQTQLVESEKMASLGQLTAGIAHEINNPINFVKGNVGPLKRDFEEIRQLFLKIQALEDPRQREQASREMLAFAKEIDAEALFEEMDMLLNGIEEGAVRTKEIVEGLRVFSRSDTDSFRHADIHAGLDATLRLLSNRIRENIEVERHYDPDLPLIECLPGKLNQVFMNILSNAVHAIESRAEAEGRSIGKNAGEILGKIILRTQKVENCLPDGHDCVRIRIEDNGTGIPAEIRNRIFDPFFTTKDVGEGTGLGLSITFGIVEQHHGRIEVESENGKGSAFIISLPLKQEE